MVESDETNNLGVSALPINIIAPNLNVSNITAPAQAQSGGPVQVTYTIHNTGAADFSGTFQDAVYLATDTLGYIYYDLGLGSFDFSGSIPAGQSVQVTRTVNIPVSVNGNR